MKVLVCGGRDFQNHSMLKIALDSLSISLLIEGGARGADTLARHYAWDNNIPVKTFPANWAKYSKAAGFIRNKQMLDEGKPDLVVAFPGGNGTANMMQLARQAKIEVWEPSKEFCVPLSEGGI